MLAADLISLSKGQRHAGELHRLNVALDVFVNLVVLVVPEASILKLLQVPALTFFVRRLLLSCAAEPRAKHSSSRRFVLHLRVPVGVRLIQRVLRNFLEIKLPLPVHSVGLLQLLQLYLLAT